MKILVACEVSGRVRDAFRRRYHTAYSCDILPAQGEFKEFHIRDDVRNHMNNGAWDMIIAFPPCTYLGQGGNALGYRGTNFELNALEFVRDIMDADAEKIAIENPRYSMINKYIRPADQYIEPWQFGDPWSKPTQLWLQNLPPLVPTKEVPCMGSWCANVRDPGRRALTFQGIANAMADQWG